MMLGKSGFGYNRPNSIAYDPVTKAYFISNQVGKSITRLDSNFDKKDVITGLTAPKDLLFATFGPYNGLLLLDSNEVKVYNATDYSFVASFKVSGAVDLEDAEADNSQTGVFYLSDPRSHTVFKVVVGGAPFYQPSFSVLSRAIRNPRALLIDQKGRLLATSDTLSTPVYEIDKSSGSATLIQRTAIDYINSIAEDLQGNFYATSWGDNYLYRLDKDFKNQSGLAVYSKPSGLYFNPKDDLLVQACYNCNKVEFHNLHLVYINDVDSGKCPGVEFYMHINQQFKGKGTYNKNNIFYAELSDIKGSFKNPVILGSLSSMEEPKDMKLIVPYHLRLSDGTYKLRIRSSSPSGISLNEVDLILPYIPRVQFGNSDSISFCPPLDYLAGNKSDPDSMYVTCIWLENGKVSSNRLPYHTIHLKDTTLLKLVKKSHVGNCISSDSLRFLPSKTLNIPFADSLKVCENASFYPGGDSISQTTIQWSAFHHNISSGVYNPEFKFDQSDTLFVKVKSRQGSCEAAKKILVTVGVVPEFGINRSQVFNCVGETIEIQPYYIRGNISNLINKWSPDSHLTLFANHKARFRNILSGSYPYQFLSEDTLFHCSDTLAISIFNRNKPEKPILGKGAKGPEITNYDPGANYFWYKNETFRPQKQFDPYFPFEPGENKNGNYRVIAQYMDSVTCSDTSEWLIINDPAAVWGTGYPDHTVYPNPFTNRINIPEQFINARFSMYDLRGIRVLDGKVNPDGIIAAEKLDQGFYYLNINFEDRNYRYPLFKQ